MLSYSTGSLGWIELVEKQSRRGAVRTRAIIVAFPCRLRFAVGCFPTSVSERTFDGLSIWDGSCSSCRAISLSGSE